MSELFGIPTSTLALVLAVVLAGSLGALVVLAVRNPVFVRLGLRNVPRRRGRTVLIVTGLMLATTIIAAAMATGDTVSNTMRVYVVTSLGHTDELVSVKGTDVESVAVGESTQVAYFPEDVYHVVREQVLAVPEVDGVAPAIIEAVAVSDPATGQNEPRVTLFAADPTGIEDFAPIRSGGGRVSLGDLRAGEVYLNSDAADELGAEAGHVLTVLAGHGRLQLRVRDVVDFDGAGTAESAVLASLRTGQRLLGVPGQIEHLLVSNDGGATSGAGLSEDVVRKLAPVVRPFGLEVDAEKRDGLEQADREGASTMSIFTTFGSFSIAAGILLIFLIFVMLAAERRGELGIARAVGTRRGHLVQMFVYEGVAYDLAAAVVGAALGVAISFGMVLAISGALAAFDIEILFGVSGRSIVVSYTLGVLLTLLVVALSAWRVSRLGIAAAVRNLPEPPAPRRRRRLVLPAVGLVLAALMVVSGVSSAQALPFMVGVSLALISLAPVARTLGLHERTVYTAAGLAMVAFWLAPADTWDFIADFSMGYGVFLAGGLLVVVGATWVVVYNAPLLLGGLGWMLGRVRALAPIVRLSVAYPLRSLFRTGVMLAMFTLVVFTLVVGVTVSSSFTNAMDDVEQFGGGFDLRAVAAPASPIPDVAAAVAEAPGIAAKDVRVAAAQAIVPLEARQAGTHAPFENYPVTGLDDAFLARTTYDLAAVAHGYRSAAEVWRAIRRRPGLAVVDPDVVPRRDNYNMEVLPDFQLSGFYLEDERFAPVPVTVRDRQTGQVLRLQVIGVLSDTAPLMMEGISTSQQTLADALGARATPTVYWLDLAPGVESRAVARELEAAFLANGLEVESLEETLDDLLAYSRTFNYLVEGFMGLGLLVGVAALGVISARSVVERRQQIGVLRSIGFQQRLIQASFLAETAFIALTSIVLGTLLGLAISYSIISDTAKQPSWTGLAMDVPWAGLMVVFFTVLAVALATTYLPARRAARVAPAEALRYQ